MGPLSAGTQVRKVCPHVPCSAPMINARGLWFGGWVSSLRCSVMELAPAMNKSYRRALVASAAA